MDVHQTVFTHGGEGMGGKRGGEKEGRRRREGRKEREGEIETDLGVRLVTSGIRSG